MLERCVELTGIGNSRELGGLIIGGKSIRRGALIRTAKLHEATPEALEKLHSLYHVNTVIDLRMSIEQNKNPDPQIKGAHNVPLPIMELEDTLKNASPEVLEKFRSGQLDLSDRMGMFNFAYENGLLDDRLYLQFLLPPRSIQAWQKFFKVLLELEEDGSVLWHCTDGKDRTGCAAMLLLYALGADRETVMHDYLLTNEYNARMLDALRNRMSQSGMPEKKLDALLFLVGSVNANYMNTAIDTLIEKYGSVMDYITDVLGISVYEIEQLKERFLI